MAEAGREERDFYGSFLREFSRVIPWGIGVIVILLVGYFVMVRPSLKKWESNINGIATLVAGTEISDLGAVSDKEISAVKENLKRAIAYSLDSAVAKSREAALDPAVVAKVKRNVKKTFDFLFDMGERRAKRAIFEDPDVVRTLKVNTRETIDFAAKRLAAYGVGVTDSDLQDRLTRVERKLDAILEALKK